MDTSQGPGMGGVTDSDEITVGSLVQFLGKTLLYGIVRWIGYLPDFPGMTAGLELVGSLYTSLTVVTLSEIPVVLKRNKTISQFHHLLN